MKQSSRLLLVGGSATLAILTTLCLHKPHAQAQGPNAPIQVKPISEQGSSADRPIAWIPPQYPTNPRVVTMNNLIYQKQGFLDATRARIDGQSEVITECQDNLDALTMGVKDEGLNVLEGNIRRTRPRIQNLKRIMEASQHKKTLLTLTADNLTRRIIQLQMQITRELQPDPSHLLHLKREMEEGVNARLKQIDPDDPYPGVELDRVAAFRAKMQPRIEVAGAALYNSAADQAVAAGDWENSEYDYYLRHKTAD